MNNLISLSAAIALALCGVVAYGQDNSMSSSTAPSFSQCDTNQDGKISRTEAQSCGLDVDWAKVDTDSSGELDRNEYDDGLQSGAIKGNAGGETQEMPGGTAPGNTSPDSDYPGGSSPGGMSP